jgi:hypothetical protein
MVPGSTAISAVSWFIAVNLVGFYFAVVVPRTAMLDDLIPALEVVLSDAGLPYDSEYCVYQQIRKFTVGRWQFNDFFRNLYAKEFDDDVLIYLSTIKTNKILRSISDKLQISLTTEDWHKYSKEMIEYIIHILSDKLGNWAEEFQYLFVEIVQRYCPGM